MKDLIIALQIFAKYKNDYSPTGCEHDVLMIYVSPVDVSAEDINKLNTLGFIADDAEDYFYSYRFGSA